MKNGIITCLLFLSGLLLRADSLWVHHIGVGQGDATLIVAWQSNGAGGVDTTSILIDAGNSSGKGDAVFAYINDILGVTKRLNFVITSHLHSDHIGGMPRVLERLVENKWNVDYIFDRGANFIPEPDICYSYAGDASNDPIEPEVLPGSSIYKSYEALVKTYFDKKRYNCMPGYELFSMMERKSNMSMMCVASNGCVLKEYGSSLYDCAQNTALDENDCSFGFLLQFDGFKYFTAGDLGGAPPYLDLETPLIPYFQSYNMQGFHFCGYKASHHGSGNSNNQAFVDYSQPQFILIPSALRSFNGTQLPWQDAWNRLQSVPGCLMTYTYHYLDQPYSGRVDYYFDIKFKVSNPGICAPVNMPVYLRSREKTNPYAPTSAYTLLNNYVCNKPHNPRGAVCPVQQPTPRQTKKINRLKQKIRKLEEKTAATQSGN